MSAAIARAKHKKDAGDRAKHAAQDEELFLSSAVLFAAKCAGEARDFRSKSRTIRRISAQFWRKTRAQRLQKLREDRREVRIVPKRFQNKSTSVD